jgi:rhomboid protease GluP
MNGRRLMPRATALLVGAILIGAALQTFTGAWSDGRALFRLGANVPLEYIVATGQYWRLVAAMFLHGGMVHLLLNLFSLYQVGSLYELMFGARRFVFIYFVAGIAASVASTLRIDGMSVGASGAIFGIVGAFISSVLRSPSWRRERSARGLVVQCVLLIIANLMIGMSVERVDNAAHVGGLVTGLLLGAILPGKRLPPPPARRVIDVQPYEG